MLAGGVALNCVANGRLLREGPFENVWIQPAAGDAGGALGAALFTWYQLLDNPRVASPHDSQRGSLLGPRAKSTDIEQFLQTAGRQVHELSATKPELLTAVSLAARRRQGGRLVLRADGVWPARAGRAQHSRRPAEHARCRAR